MPFQIKRIELGEYARPVCPSGCFDLGSDQKDVAILYWNPREGGVPDLKRADPEVVDVKQCM